MPRRQTSNEIDAAAAQWVARMDRGPLSDVDQAAFDAWVGAETRRLGAFAKASAVMAHADRSQALGHDFDPADFAAPARSRRTLVWGAAAAGVTGVGLWTALPNLQGATLRTAKGEIRRLPLSDSSTVVLNTQSQIRVRYTDRLREIDLLRGEALFDVAKDPRRPFVVRAGDTSVRAVGTSFTVRRFADDRVKVLVREGVVEVARHAAPTPVRVTANACAVTLPVKAAPETRSVEVASVSPSEVARVLSWRDGMLAFDGETMTAAAQEFARYSDTRIVIENGDLGRETITGLFSANDPVGFAKAAAISLGGQAVEAPGEVIISR